MHPPLPSPLLTWDQYSTFPLEKSVRARVDRETAKIQEKPDKEEDLRPEFCYPKWKMWERMAALSNGDCGRKPWGGLQEEIFRNLSNTQEERPLSRNSESDGHHFITNPLHCKSPVRGVSRSAGDCPDLEIIRQRSLVSATNTVTHQSQSGKISFMQYGKEKPCEWVINSTVTIP